MINELDNSKHIIAANEGSAVSIGIGYYLSTKKISCVYLPIDCFKKVSGSTLFFLIKHHSSLSLYVSVLIYLRQQLDLLIK